MNYASRERGLDRHLPGLALVVLMHLLLGYALVNGLARKVIEVIRAPVQTKIIEEEKPPPPPEPQLPPPPPLVLPPPSFVPPPEVKIASPPAPTITVTTVSPPPAPVVIVPVPATPAPASPPAPPPRSLARAAQVDVSHCDRPEYPAAARRESATGTTTIRFDIDAAGHVKHAQLIHASGFSREHRLLDQRAIAALSQCAFKPGTDERGRAIGGTATVDYVWKLED